MTTEIAPPRDEISGSVTQSSKSLASKLAVRKLCIWYELFCRAWAIFTLPKKISVFVKFFLIFENLFLIFDKNFFIFDKNFHVWQKFSCLTKIFIFNKNFHFWQICFQFWQIFRFWLIFLGKSAYSRRQPRNNE